jgi:uncharacterized membrane protein
MTIRGPFAILLSVVLIVSLAANFLVLGFAAARFAGVGPFGGDIGAIERIVALGARAFPRALRHEIGGQLGRHRGELRAALDEVRDARRRMFAVMAAEPFDRAALDAAFAEVRAATDRLQLLGQDLVGDVVERAPPEERARIRPPPFLR